MNLKDLLNPLELETFLNEYFQKNYIHISREDSNYYTNLFNIDDVNEYLYKRDIRYPSIKLVKDGLSVNHNVYLDNIPFGNSSFEGLLNNEKMFELFKKGATIILQSHQRHNKRLRDLTLSLQNETFSKYQANIYITPSSSQGFLAHYDVHDVIILQVYGEKEWFLYDSPEYLPTINETFFSSEHSKKDYDKETPVFNKTLKQGDLLYIPRGLVHKAVTNNKMSMHITLGIYPLKYHNLLKYLAENSTSLKGFREVIPIKNSSINLNDLKNDIIEKLNLFMESKQFTDILTKYIDFHTYDRIEPSFSDRFIDLEKTSLINIDSIFIKNKFHKYKVINTDKDCSIKLYDKKITFPIFMLETLNGLLYSKENKIKVSDLKGKIDDEIKILFIQKLVSNGFLNIYKI